MFQVAEYLRTLTEGFVGTIVVLAIPALILAIDRRLEQQESRKAESKKGDIARHLENFVLDKLQEKLRARTK